MRMRIQYNAPVTLTFANELRAVDGVLRVRVLNTAE